MPYSFAEIRKICARCRDFRELEKAAKAFIIIMEDQAMEAEQIAFTQKEIQIRFRQLKV